MQLVIEQTLSIFNGILYSHNVPIEWSDTIITASNVDNSFHTQSSVCQMHNNHRLNNSNGIVCRSD